MIYVSFVTKKTPYEEAIQTYLLPSLKKFNLPYDIAYYESKGSWINNVQYKAQFLKEMLIKHKQPIVSLDADAVIHKPPVLFTQLDKYDLAAHILEWRAWYRKKSTRKELLGGTLYLNYTDKTLTLLDKWIELHKIEKKYPQNILEKLIEKNKFQLDFYELPITYCFIETNRFPLIKKEAVIIHHQLSRRYRRRLS